MKAKEDGMMSMRLLERWDSHFGFIQGAKLEGAYSLLLGLARSVSGLRRLHGLLPDNCRLGRDDLLDLIDFWVLLYGGSPPRDGEQMPDDSIKVLLTPLLEGRDLTNRYLALLDVGRADERAFSNSDAETIFSHSGRIGHGREHFEAEVNGINLLVSCCLSDDERILGVRFATHQKTLTENTTHVLQNAFLTSRVSRSGFRGRMWNSLRGWEVDFWYTLPAEGLLPLLERPSAPHERKERLLIATDAFLTELFKQLQGLGIGITSLMPILPSPRPADEATA